MSNTHVKKNYLCINNLKKTIFSLLYCFANWQIQGMDNESYYPEINWNWGLASQEEKEWLQNIYDEEFKKYVDEILYHRIIAKWVIKHLHLDKLMHRQWPTYKIRQEKAIYQRFKKKIINILSQYMKQEDLILPMKLKLIDSIFEQISKSMMSKMRQTINNTAEHFVLNDHIFSIYINIFSFYSEVFKEFSLECVKLMLAADDQRYSISLVISKIENILTIHINILTNVFAKVSTFTIKLIQEYESLIDNMCSIVEMYKNNQEIERDKIDKERENLRLLQIIGKLLQEKIIQWPYPYHQASSYKKEVEQFITKCMATTETAEMQKALQARNKSIENQIKEQDNIIERQNKEITEQAVLIEMLKSQLEEKANQFHREEVKKK